MYTEHTLINYVVSTYLLFEDIKGSVEFYLQEGVIPTPIFSKPKEFLAFDDTGLFWNAAYKQAPYQGTYKYSKGKFEINGVSIGQKDAINYFFTHYLPYTSHMLSKWDQDKDFLSILTTTHKYHSYTITKQDIKKGHVMPFNDTPGFYEYKLDGFYKDGVCIVENSFDKYARLWEELVPTPVVPVIENKVLTFKQS